VIDALEGPQERFLCQVARFFNVFGEPVQQTINLPGAFVDQDFESGRVATL
jgi:hypothetical protein